MGKRGEKSEKVGEKWEKVVKSGEKLEKVAKIWKKWGKVEKVGKVGKSSEKWGKVGTSWNKWGKLGKSWEKLGKVGKGWKKWGNFGWKKWGIFFAKWPPPAILDDQKSLSIAFLAISDQYATFIFGKKILNGRRPPFWKSLLAENYFRINTQLLFFLNFFSKWPPAAFLRIFFSMMTHPMFFLGDPPSPYCYIKLLITPPPPPIIF